MTSLTPRARRSNDTGGAEVHLPRFPANLFTDRYLLIVPLDQPRSLLSVIRFVAVGSTNPVKLSAVRAVLAPLAPQARIDSVAVASTVADQPFGDDDTIRGALARASAARDALGAELGIGIEGGVVEQANGEMRTCAWAGIVDKFGRTGVGGSLAMPLPRRVAQMIRDGLELGHAMDLLVGEHDTKRGRGAVGILTADLVDRQRAYEILVTYALAPFLTPELYSDERRAGITPVY